MGRDRSPAVIPPAELVLRHDGFVETPWRRDEPSLLASSADPAALAAGRSVKLDLKEGGSTMTEAIELVDASGLREERVWLNAELPAVGQRGFGRFASVSPVRRSRRPWTSSFP